MQSFHRINPSQKCYASLHHHYPLMRNLRGGTDTNSLPDLETKPRDLVIFCAHSHMQVTRNERSTQFQTRRAGRVTECWVVHGSVHSNLQAFFRSTPNATSDRAERSGCGVFFLAIEEEELKRAFTRAGDQPAPSCHICNGC